MIKIIDQYQQKIITGIVISLLLVPVWIQFPSEQQVQPEPPPRTATLSHSNATNLWDHIQQSMGYTLSQNAAVAEQIRAYQAHPATLEIALLRSEPYLYHIVTALEKRNLPLAFALLPVVESAYDPQALSHAGALGLWQLMPATANDYGVPAQGLYDGRLDLVASTEAALDYLSYLGELFDQDWLLVIAAYNAGEGTVMRAIKQNEAAGLPTDFWSLPLPQETKQHVPKLLAVAELVSQPIRYGIELPHTPAAPVIDYVELHKQIDVTVAAKLAGISLDELYALNPGYKQRKPRPDGPHRLFLPTDRVDVFEQRLSQL